MNNSCRPLRKSRALNTVMFMFMTFLPVVICTDSIAADSNSNKQTKIADRIEFQAYPFELAAVRLLPGPFRLAQQLDANYLLLLEADRLLSGFRKEAGLQPKAEGYGGWEKEGIAGHSLGHYLSACAMMYASTGDSRFKERVNYIVDELELCQRAHGDGYVAAIPDGRRVFAEIASGDIRAKGFDLNGIWVPWYTLHKELAGLLDAQHYCDNQKALIIAGKLADFALEITKNLNEEQFQRMLACEHGGMNEVLAELCARTAKGKYLNLSKRFHHKFVLDPLTRHEDKLAGLHANTNIPKLIGLARRYEITGDLNDKTAAEYFWDRMVNHHSYVIGGNSSYEYLAEADKLDKLLSNNTCETCNTYNMLKLTQHLFCWQVKAAYADYYERALYNHILASQHPGSGMFCYYIPLKPGAFKEYSDPYDSFWCCVGTGMENHAKYNGNIYFHDDDGLWVNLYIASELRWSEKGLNLRQETNFPESDKIHFNLQVKKPIKLTMRFRYPSWAQNGINVLVNGETQKVHSAPGSYVDVQRTWKNGDTIEITIPMSLRTEPLPDNPQRVAVCYGPLVLAGELGKVEDVIVKGQNYVPVFITGGNNVNEWIKPLPDKADTFQTVAAGRPRDVLLYPFYKMHNKRYSVYWEILTEDQWLTRQEEIKAELARIRELEGRTVDFVQPGEAQSEKDHNQQGDKTNSGEAWDGKYRHAYEGGWFSFDLKVQSDTTNILVCTFWGGDSGQRTFDILVDGQILATQSLRNNKPGEFIDVNYPLPRGLTSGKNKVTVKFQAHADNTAGGVFGVRVVQ
jgi:DUF1680 family protein